MADRDPRAVARDHAMRLYRELEARVLPVVQLALDNVAEAFARQVLHADHALNADDITAQGEFDPAEVDRIRSLWANEVPTIIATLRIVYEAGEHSTIRRLAGQAFLDEVLADPEHPVGRLLTERVDTYLSGATNRLHDVGDGLWQAARETLADGVAAGEGHDVLAQRLQERFALHGVELGDTRAERISRTQVQSAWNQASRDSARALPTDIRPAYKTWIATLDRRTRDSHFSVDGVTIALEQHFDVNGTLMDGPHDESAPLAELANCRCTLAYGDDPDELPALGQDRQYKDDAEIEQVVEYFEQRGVTRDAGRTSSAATLMTSAAGCGPGSHLQGAPMPDPPPPDVIAAAHDHDGAMVALVPTAEDQQRLALPDGEPAEELHLTLLYLGKAADWPASARQTLIDMLSSYDWDAPDGTVEGNAFGAAHWNPDSDNPAWVLNVGGDALPDLHAVVGLQVAGARGQDDSMPEVPAQHQPWAAHVCITYDSDPTLLAPMEQRLGPIKFDRLRVAFAGQHTDIPLDSTGDTMPDKTAAAGEPRQVRRWHTPGETALAFEDTETGDGRIFAPGALYWEGDAGWPLQYADEMLWGHQGAELAGSIEVMARSGRRIAGAGDLYEDVDAGAKSVDLLERGAPLGVSVDLDDVTLELVDARPAEVREEDPLMASADGTPAQRIEITLPALSVMRLDTGAYALGLAGPTLRQAITAAGVDLTAAGITAAAGDHDDPEDGEILFVEQTGDILLRITRARVRGATLVSIPAFDEARIVLEDTTGEDPFNDPTTAAAGDSTAPLGELMLEVCDYVRAADGPVRPGQLAEALGIAGTTARTYLSRAVAAGRLLRPARGLYTAPATPAAAAAGGQVVAALAGDVNLPIHDDRDREWDGDEAASRVLAWAQEQAEDSDDPPARWLRQAFLWFDDDANPDAVGSYSLGFADVIDDELRIVARGVFATAGGRGVDSTDLDEDDKEAVRARICTLYERLAEHFDEDLVCPWQRDEEASADAMIASAWAEFDALPPLPAHWFAQPTGEELPPDSGGVHLTDEGRIYGWVAQAGVPHEGYPGRNMTIADLQPIDTTWFLRKKFKLDDGTEAPLGPFVMNVGHHRDGGNCETQACLWDDSKTIAGLITVGFADDGGMWFSGAAAPWLSNWDRMAFLACQPSYHMVAKPEGGYKLGSVLAVPRPGHPSRLAASAVVDRANLLLAPAAAVTSQTRHLAAAATSAGLDLAQLSQMVAAAVVEEQDRRERLRAEKDALAAEMAELAGR